MAYKSLRDFIQQLEADGETGSGVRAGVDRAGDDRDPDPAAAKRRPGGAVRKAGDAGRNDQPHPLPGQSVRHGEAGGDGGDAGGQGAHHHGGTARGGGAAGLPAQSHAAARSGRRDGDAAAGADRHVDAAQDGEEGSRSGRGAERRTDRPDRPSRSVLLARRTGAPDHLGSGGDQGAVGRPRGRLQPGHLPDAGAGQGQGHHALAGPSAAALSTTPGTRRPESASPCPAPWCWAPIRGRSWPP